jgi:hypothetical protein
MGGLSEQALILGTNRDAVSLKYSDSDTCVWFISCGNRPAGIIRHPSLGPVPCCKPCAVMLRLKLEEVPAC